jgi:hypothetical protein
VAHASTEANVEGQVTDKVTGQPVAGAQVLAADEGLSASTDGAGRFRWQAIPLSQSSLPITITISADGYGSWTIEDVRLRAGDTLILSAELSAAPTLIVVPPPRAEAPDWPDVSGDKVLGGLSAAALSDLSLPSTIRVRVTGYAYCDLTREYTVETVDFKEYVKHVLPNEWVPNWPWESLRAGAMAAKMYAWYWIAQGGKWSDADVYDSTCDQVYNPSVSYASTDAAVDFTWNWALTRSGALFQTSYRTYYSQCESAGLAGNCMGQVESRDMAYDAYTWDEIVYAFYTGTGLSPVWDPPGGFALRYFGNGYGDLDRVKIQIDDPSNSDPGPPADVGRQDFTLEWWMKALPGENTAGPVTCGDNTDWIYANILLDRDRFNQDRKFGVSLADGRLVFGVSGDGTGDLTLCSTTRLDDGLWHHVAVQRRHGDDGETRDHERSRLPPIRVPTRAARRGLGRALPGSPGSGGSTCWGRSATRRAASTASSFTYSFLGSPA